MRPHEEMRFSSPLATHVVVKGHKAEPKYHMFDPSACPTKETPCKADTGTLKKRSLINLQHRLGTHNNKQLTAQSAKARPVCKTYQELIEKDANDHDKSLNIANQPRR